MPTTIVNLVIMARIQDWLFEHVVIAPKNAAHPDLRWLAQIMAGGQRPNVMMVVDQLCTMCGWGICDLTHTVSQGRIYWHLMLKSPGTTASPFALQPAPPEDPKKPSPTLLPQL
jgi:hypothetical protein